MRSWLVLWCWLVTSSCCTSLKDYKYIKYFPTILLHVSNCSICLWDVIYYEWEGCGLCSSKQEGTLSMRQSLTCSTLWLKFEDPDTLVGKYPVAILSCGEVDWYWAWPFCRAPSYKIVVNTFTGFWYLLHYQWWQCEWSFYLFLVDLQNRVFM